MSLTPAHRKLLTQCFLFQNLPPEALESLGDSLEAETFPAGTVIYSRTRFRKAIGVLLEGRLSVLKSQDLLLKTLEPGQCFGVAALFCPTGDYVTTVRAKTPATLVFLPDQWLVTLFERYPQTAVDYITFLSQRIRFLNRKIDSFTAPTTQEAVLGYLLDIRREDGTARIAGGYSQLARALNIGRASLYRALDALEEEGCIRREGKTVLFLSQTTDQ